MKNTALIVSDLHLNDTLETEYRWGIFNWVREAKEKHGFQQLFILGDITDQKDRHSGKLINRGVDELVGLAEALDIYILRGNHDGLDPAWPYFRFLNHFKHIMFIPETQTIQQDNSVPLHFYAHGYSKYYHPNPKGISFFHETFRGTRYENGQVADGEHFTDPHFGTVCFSGDIHMPQQVGDVIYIGSPYHTRFGDRFDPRGILLDLNNRSFKSLPISIGKKIILNITSEKDFMDQMVNLDEKSMVRIQILDTETKDSTKLFQFLSDHKKEYPSIQQIHIIKEGAEQLPTLIQSPKKDTDLIHEYGAIKNLPKERIAVGVELHENA